LAELSDDVKKIANFVFRTSQLASILLSLLKHRKNLKFQEKLSDIYIKIGQVFPPVL